MTSDDAKELFKKFDTMNEKFMDMRLGVKGIEDGQIALVKEIERIGEIAKQTNDTTLNCPARTEWTAMTRRVDGIERRGGASIPPVSSNGGRAGAVLKAFGPWIFVGLVAIGSGIASYSRSEDATKAAEAAKAAVDTATKAAEAVGKITAAVDRIETKVEATPDEAAAAYSESDGRSL